MMVLVFEQVHRLQEQLRRMMSGFDAQLLSARDAKDLLVAFGEMERLCAAGKMLAAARVAHTSAWTESGHRSAAEWLASETGTTIASARGVLETATRIEKLPAVEDAVRAGKLSETQAREVAAAASVDPHAEEQLLASAATNGVI